MDTRNQPLEPGNVYHIYNRGIGKEKIFTNRDNYLFFLSKVTKYILPICDILSYCLLPDHFHFLIRVKSEKELHAFATEIKKEKTELPVLISEQFANCFNSYSKAFNKVFQRHGKLFDLPFKRIEVDSDKYYTILVAYIHRNPVHHGIVKKFTDWEFSSYKAYLSDAPSRVAKREILGWFGNVQEFIKFHEGSLQHFTETNLCLE